MPEGAAESALYAILVRLFADPAIFLNFPHQTMRLLSLDVDGANAVILAFLPLLDHELREVELRALDTSQLEVFLCQLNCKWFVDLPDCECSVSTADRLDIHMLGQTCADASRFL